MIPDPIEIYQHTTTSGTHIVSTGDDHNVRSTKITKHEVVAVQQRDRITDVLEDLGWARFTGLDPKPPFRGHGPSRS